jgi:hypothetical protein
MFPGQRQEGPSGEPKQKPVFAAYLDLSKAGTR